MKIVVVKFKDRSRLPIIGNLIEDSEDQIIIDHVGYYDDCCHPQVVWSRDSFFIEINRRGFPLLKEEIERYYNPSEELENYFMSHYQEHEGLNV